MHFILSEHCRPNTVEHDFSPFLAIKILRLLHTSGFAESRLSIATFIKA